LDRAFLLFFVLLLLLLFLLLLLLLLLLLFLLLLLLLLLLFFRDLAAAAAAADAFILLVPRICGDAWFSYADSAFLPSLSFCFAMYGEQDQLLLLLRLLLQPVPVAHIGRRDSHQVEPELHHPPNRFQLPAEMRVPLLHF